MINNNNIVKIKGQKSTSLVPDNGLKISEYSLSKKETPIGRTLKASFRFKRTLKLTMAAATAKKALKRNKPKCFLTMFLKTIKTNFNLLSFGFKKEGKIVDRAIHYIYLPIFYLFGFSNFGFTRPHLSGSTSSVTGDKKNLLRKYLMA